MPPREAPVRGARRRLITVAVLVTAALGGLDTSVVTTAMPTVVGQLGGITLYAWVFSGYLLASTVAVPIGGKLADLYGRKPVFLVAGGLFALGSALSGQAQSMDALIAFRVLQGVGAGGLMVTMTILGDVYALEERARILGLYSMLWSASALVGPAVGGFLTERVSWRWAFYVNLPLTLAAMALIGYALAEPRRAAKVRVDALGALLLAGTVAAFQLGLTGGQTDARLLGASGVLLIGFVAWERRAPEPILPFGLLRTSAVGGGALSSLLMGLNLLTQSTFVPPFLQSVLGASPTVSGLVVAVSSIGWSAASVACGRAVIRWGYRAMGLVGAGLLALGVGLLWSLQPGASLLLAAVSELVIGLGFGTLAPVCLLCMQNAVGWEQRGVVSSLNGFANNIGGTVGVSVAGALFAASVVSAHLGADPNALLTASSRADLPPAELAAMTDALSGALHAVYVGMLVAAGLGVLAALVLPGGRPEPRADEQPPVEAAMPVEPGALLSRVGDR